MVKVIVGLSLGLGLLFTQTIAAPLKGRVMGPNGQPASFLVISVDGQKIACQTDAQGYFTLDIAPGTYGLAFRGLGFETLHQEIPVAETGTEVWVVMGPAEKEEFQSEFMRFRAQKLLEELRREWGVPQSVFEKQSALLPGAGVFIHDLPTTH